MVSDPVVGPDGKEIPWRDIVQPRKRGRPKKMSVEGLVLKDLKAIDLNTAKTSKGDDSPNETFLAYAMSGLSVLNAIAQSTEAPIDMRMSAAEKLADVFMSLAKKGVGVQPASGAEIPPDISDVSEDEYQKILHSSHAAHAQLSLEQEEIPEGWGEEPGADQEPSPTQTPPPAYATARIVPINPAAVPPASAYRNPDPLKSRKLTTEEKILRLVHRRGEVTMKTVRDCIKDFNGKRPEDIDEAMESLASKGVLWATRRGASGFYAGRIVALSVPKKSRKQE
jgi:hypothetical protein